VLPTVSAESKPYHKWTYRDIQTLPSDQQTEWRKVCETELNILKEQNIYEYVDVPKGHKVINNCWVFDVKPNDCKCAHLVAKGFSPVVRFETVRLMLALASLENWHIEGLNVRSAY